MTLREYIAEIDRQYRTGIAREHSYRPALQQLLAGMLPACVVTNEPAREECGAPDYIIVRQRDNMPVGFIEAKDIGDSDLDGHKQHREQFSRYKAALDHLIFTDYLDFHLYIDGEAAGSVRVGEERDGHIRMVEGCEEAFGLLIRQMAEAAPQRITSSTRLAQQMAMKTRLLAEAIRRAFDESNRERDNSQLQDILDAFRRILIHDLAPEEFADIYAQTIAYGMFAARLHDDTPEDFSRMEAASLIPRTNPFLRNIFQRIAGFDLDPRIAWIVDDLACTFAATDVRRIMKRYERDGRHSDPMIHFYEDFLSAYNPRLRKSRGVWYTPQSVVGFIVRTVDELLRREFSLPLGLADYSCVSREVKNTQYNKNNRKDRPTYKVQFHKVQLLDPAAGTGTFLAEAVQQIHDKFSRQAGLWQSYVEEHLLPRLNGFELLMASYAVAHLKLDMVLGETGYEPHTGKRLRIYLTNSLEECHPDTSTLFDRWLSDEANEANRIKRDTPVMVMMGNPPYNGSSKNKGAWIMKLMDTYKKEPGGRLPLKERNPKWLNDDYVKFIRLAQDYIERTGEGILAFINPHGYLDNPTFRGMRWQLLRTFDRIYAIDLHGNSKKKETCPDGTNIVDDCRVSNKTKERGYVFPLYVERESGEAGKIFEKNRFAPNFVPETLQKIEQSLGEEAEPTELFCYIYAVLHSPTYRERYKEFLKTDFPRIPYPTDTTLYHNLAEKGCKLCRLHLMESTDTWETGTTYPVGGSNVVEEVRYADGRVYINKEQYFDHIPEEAWNFCVGGYQPAQKWLKDRKGRRLDGFKDNLHYEHIIHALTRTIEIMQEIECESRGLWSSGH